MTWCTDGTLIQMTSPAQDGSTRIQDSLASFLYSEDESSIFIYSLWLQLTLPVWLIPPNSLKKTKAVQIWNHCCCDIYLR